MPSVAHSFFFFYTYFNQSTKQLQDHGPQNALLDTMLWVMVHKSTYPPSHSALRHGPQHTPRHTVLWVMVHNIPPVTQC